MPSYFALVKANHSSGYGAIFPDFLGCVAVANSLAELKAMAEEVLVFHIEGMIEDGNAVPGPSSLDDLLKSEDNKLVSAILVVDCPDVAAMQVRAAGRRLALLGGSDPEFKAAPRRRTRLANTD